MRQEILVGKLAKVKAKKPKKYKSAQKPKNVYSLELTWTAQSFLLTRPLFSLLRMQICQASLFEPFLLIFVLFMSKL